MTYKTLREKISGSEHYELFNDLKININLPHLGFQKQYKGINDIYRFYRQQADAWEKISGKLPGTIKNSKNHFIHNKQKIINFVEQNADRNEQGLKNNWRTLNNLLSSRTTNNGNNPIFLAEAPETTFLLEVYRDYPEAFGGAHEFITTPDGTNINRNISPGVLKGYILAYEFRLQNYTDIQQRRHNEKISLGQIRSKFEDYLQQAEKDIQSIFKETKDNYDQHVQAIDALEKKKEELFDQWFGESMNSFKEFFKSAQDDAKSMKELFRDGLRFAGPVKYWRRRALQMKKNGAWWIKWFTGSVIVTAISLFILLWLIPESMSTSLFNGEPAAIKWTLLFVTFISFMAYGVRTFAKLTFSSFHLARDAEEREQLTHIYLALKKDANVAEEDRLIILQSLFSRAETGLLKDDSAPTMPTSLLEKLGK